MIQRKQTLFILLSIILCAVCLCMPLASVEMSKLGHDATLYNLCMWHENGGCEFSYAVLFVLQAFTYPAAIVAMFKFKNRRLQMRLCKLCVLLLCAWYVALLLYCLRLPDDASLHPNVAVVLPFVSGVLYCMALHGIKADDELIKSVDRIR